MNRTVIDELTAGKVADAMMDIKEGRARIADARKMVLWDVGLPVDDEVARVYGERDDGES